MLTETYGFFTQRARNVMQRANLEAHRFRHHCIATEHILLGLVMEPHGIAATILQSFDIEPAKVRAEVEKVLQYGPTVPFMTELPLSPSANSVIANARLEARKFNQDEIDTEHLLLGLLHEECGVAGVVLLNLGLNHTDVRAEVHYLRRGGSFRRFPGCTSPMRQIEDLPTRARQTLMELEPRIDELNQGKWSAVAIQDFVRAADLRDQADELKRQKQAALREWPAVYAIDRSWLAWNDGAVTKIARMICDDLSWGALPILGDALEEAGCTDQEILSHCRQAANHGGSCWVINLLLGQV